MPTISIFDPAMCCSSGVCGEDVDQTLVDAAAAISAARSEGIDIARHNLASDPLTFASTPAVRALLENEGAAALPAVVVGDRLVMTGVYPTLGQLRTWAAASAAAPTEAAPAQTAPATPPTPTDAPTPRTTLPLAATPCCSGESGCC